MHLESMPLFNAFDPQTDTRAITIAANVTELLPEMKAIFQRLRTEIPGRHIRYLELGSRDNLEPMLDSGQADIALSIRPDVLPTVLESRNIILDDVRVYYDPEMRGPVTSLDEYFSAEHAVLDFGGPHKSVVAQRLESTGRERTIALAASNVYALAELVRGTPLIASFQKSLANAAFKGLHSTPAPFETNHVVFDLIWHRRHASAPRNIWLRNLVLEEMGKA